MSSLLIEENVRPEEMPRLSPSSINLFDQDPALWVLKHYYGQTSDFNIHAMRGVAIEDGINAMYEKGLTLEQAKSEALISFGEKAFFWGDDELFEDIEAKIPEWTANAIKELEAVRGENKPTTQAEILTEIEGMPVRGFIDFTYDDEQIDLKTVSTVKRALTRGARKGLLPAEKKSNVRQQAIYQKATGLKTSLLYVSPDDSYYHVLDEKELDEAMNDVVQLVKDMKDVINSPIEEVIERSIPKWKSMNYSFYWDDNLRQLAHKLWGKYKPEGGDDGY